MGMRHGIFVHFYRLLSNFRKKMASLNDKTTSFRTRKYVSLGQAFTPFITRGNNGVSIKLWCYSGNSSTPPIGVEPMTF